MNRRLLYANNGGAGDALSGQTFFAPLRTTLVPGVAAGSATPTFTRATTATVMAFSPTAVPGDPLLVTAVASGEARFYGARRISSGVWSDTYADGTPISFATLRGYLAEGARTNLCLYSGDFSNAVWTTTTVSGTGTAAKTANYAVAPDGTLTACRVVATKGSGFGLMRQQITGLSNPHGSAISIWIKSNTGASQVVNFSDSNKAFATATVTTEWTRFSSVATGVAATSSVLDIGAAGSSDASVDVLVWGGQLELDATFSSSYIPTTSASAPRNADVLSYALAGNISGTAGTSFAELTTEWTGTTATRRDIVASATGSPLYVESSAGKLSVNDGAAQLGNVLTGSTSFQKVASTWAGSAAFTYIAGTASSSLSFDGDIGLTTSLDIGNQGGATQLFGTLRNLRVFNRALTSAEVRSL